ncbi:hypothetical protein E4K64_33365 [Bradyrhizobium frederickii]|uniref:Uncharacterized protein n=1 Tax=Bradyrhizobium frederickii TaxID=2560054 RepID=A0A4Y9NRS4_9BRAD|nr:hypothetical protein [Bradyrhizobium frederickii]TFV69423.1 hypothetical protein E4K64_33365 [Bradyrhizobium frederickii]
MINLSRSTVDRNLPGAFFSSSLSYLEFHTERREYEAATEAFATEASPAGIRESLKFARRHGFKMTKAEAREAAADALREKLTALGYGETDIRWHAARRGRRDRHFYRAA